MTLSDAMTAPKLSVENIHKTFFKPVKNDVIGVPALNGVSLSVTQGDFVSVIGPSGCGKSTLLRIVDGLIQPDQGRVLVDGRVVDGPGPDRAVVFQYFGLYPWRSVLRNVEFGLELKGMPRQQRREIALATIAQVGLRGFENHFPHELSGGMRQRVGFARALSLDPEIILMDEPFSSVDEQTRELLQEQLLELWRETRKTVLFVTHSIDEAVYVANRVVVMAARPGRIVEDINYRSAPPAHQQRPGTAALWRDQVPCLGNSQTVYRRGDGAGCTPMTAPDDAALLAVRARVRRSKIDRFVIVAMTLAGFLSLWEISGHLTNPMFFAPVSEVLIAFWQQIIDPSHTLLSGLVETLAVLVPGFLIACILGLVLGVLMGRSNLALQVLDPYVTIFYNTPRVALIPVLLLWLGVGDTLKIVIVVLAAVFPVSVNVTAGIRDISAQFTEPARSMNATEGQLLWKVILPATLPYVMAGLKLGLGRALTTVIVAEFFVSLSGLGGILHAASSTYQMAKMFAPAIILAAMGITIDGLLTYLERRVLQRYRA